MMGQQWSVVYIVEYGGHVGLNQSDRNFIFWLQWQITNGGQYGSDFFSEFLQNVARENIWITSLVYLQGRTAAWTLTLISSVSKVGYNGSAVFASGELSSCMNTCWNWRFRKWAFSLLSIWRVPSSLRGATPMVLATWLDKKPEGLVVVLQPTEEDFFENVPSRLVHGILHLFLGYSILHPGGRVAIFPCLVAAALLESYQAF